MSHFPPKKNLLLVDLSINLLYRLWLAIYYDQGRLYYTLLFAGLCLQTTTTSRTAPNGSPKSRCGRIDLKCCFADFMLRYNRWLAEKNKKRLQKQSNYHQHHHLIRLPKVACLRSLILINPSAPKGTCLWECRGLTLPAYQYDVLNNILMSWLIDAFRAGVLSPNAGILRRVW